MRTQVMRRLLAPLTGLAIALMGVSVPAYAGEDKGLCNENHSRGTIPGDFPLDVCFDGKTLTIKNGTQFPLVLKFTGNDVGSVQLDSRSAGAAARLIAYMRPGQFGRTPVINSPDVRSGIVPPGYYVRTPIGNGEAKVNVTTAKADVQKTYVLAETIWRFMPAEVAIETMKAVAELIRELVDVGGQYIECRDRNNAWGDVGCSALQGRNVAFAYGRAAVSGLGGGVVKAVVSLFDTAGWADAASGDLIKLKDGKRDFTIAAYQPPVEPPKEEPKQPQPTTKPPNNNGGNNGGGNAPPPVDNPPPPQTAVATVQNKHLEGGSGLGEDSTPSYLSTVMQPRCASSGCKINGTDMWSEDTFTAICWDTGAMMTNQNKNVPDDDNNPNRIDSDRWLKGQKSGATGYISYIYVTPGSRNLNIPHC